MNAWLLAAALLAPVLGCDGATGVQDPPTEPTTSAPDRYFSRYTGAGRNWIPAEAIEIGPQRAPMMLIWETTGFPPGSAARPQQRAAAEAFRAASFAAAREKGWFDYQTGLDAGFELMFGDEAHYVNEEYIVDGVLLDPERPEFLMYYDTPQGKRLVGYMFYVTEPDAHGPQFGGPLTVWHFHTWNQRICLLKGLLAVARPDASGRCELGASAWRSPEMLHVWLVDHPGGHFATNMKLAPKLVARLVSERGF